MLAHLRTWFRPSLPSPLCPFQTLPLQTISEQAAGGGAWRGVPAHVMTPSDPIAFLESPVAWARAWAPEAGIGIVGGEALRARCSAVALTHAAAAADDVKYRGLLMTESQSEVFESILERRWQVVWGPPGTGKTHFLALAILRYGRPGGTWTKEARFGSSCGPYRYILNHAIMRT